MQENSGKKWGKFVLSLIAFVSSVTIEAELVQEEKLAEKEQRFGDLVLLGIGHSVKRNTDLALFKWIADL
jgi:hypothetical protein